MLPLVFIHVAAVAARLHHALAEDLHAFPKHRVVFLNGSPVLNHTATRWLDDGLEGGLREFLDQPWTQSIEASAQAGHEQPALEAMRLGQRSFVCLIPRPDEGEINSAHISHPETSPASSWNLLQPLSGACLYHRQAWFTYSYCHNNHIRQFRESAHPHPHPADGYVPQEDPEWEAYTLGRAPHPPNDDRELSLAPPSNTVELAQAPGHQYLVQRWTDGTQCDKTSEPREIEVQFHCSMTMTDTILLVKETKTCHYVMVIQTPRLCGVPGFKSRLQQRDEARIRCREVVDSIDDVDTSLPESPYPFVKRLQKPTLVAPPPTEPPVDEKQQAHKKDASEFIKRALESLMQEGSPRIQVQRGDQESEVWIELVGDTENIDMDDESLESLVAAASNRISEALRAAAGHDVKERDDRQEDDEHVEHIEL